jgi:hypothetical protein
MNTSDTELQLLEAIYIKRDEMGTLTQRDLAGVSGLSLGMTNALLKRFAERGWVKLKHLSGHSLKYILTPEGVEEVLRRSFSFFTRAVRSASLYRDKIDIFVHRLAKNGYDTLVLEGPAELDFLFDYSCERYSLHFVKNPLEPKRSALLSNEWAMFIQTTASISWSRDSGPRASVISLVEILFGSTGKSTVDHL